MSKEAGHDINYVAVSGKLIVVKDVFRFDADNRGPYIENILASCQSFGRLCWRWFDCSFWYRSSTLSTITKWYSLLLSKINSGGKGCIIDCSMVEGLAYLGTFITMYKDVDYMWNMDYAFFGGTSPIYR